MFGDEFLRTMGSLSAMIVFLFALLGVALAGYSCYKAGQSNRKKLEKRSGLYERVEAQRNKEVSELKAMAKRRSEIT